jgi:hypothetical protein
MHGKPAVQESEIEKCAHVRRKTQHLIQNLVHEEFRLKVEEVRAYTGVHSEQPCQGAEKRRFCASARIHSHHCSHVSMQLV